MTTLGYQLKVLSEGFREIFSKDGNLPSAGLYHHRIQLDGGYSRVHLRVNPDVSGCLVIDAAQMIHLNPTATVIAYHYLNGKSEERINRIVSRSFAVDSNELMLDVRQTINQIHELTRPNGACPIHELEMDTTMPFSARLTAPYRMDLAVTYRCNNDCHHCYNARSRSFPEMDTLHWKRVIDKVWDLSIPHIVFTGGEPTLKEDLPKLISYAEKKGMITGLNTNGRRLSQAGYVTTLVDAGLDHVQITLESHLPDIHDQIVNSIGAWKQTNIGIQNAVNSQLYVMTNTTLLQSNSLFIDGLLDYLSEAGVPTIGLNSLIYSGKGANVNSGLKEAELDIYLSKAKDHVQKSGQKLIWYTPTQYCHFDPVTQELGIKGCSAARYNMCIEPDGSVLPCQSYYVSLGNLLKDDWEIIWNHPLSESIRNRSNIPEKCTGCSLVVECGGGCPLQFENVSESESKVNQYII
jgi:radical SAM protein with 4Fe4S-binding SPASM domain